MKSPYLIRPEIALGISLALAIGAIVFFQPVPPEPTKKEQCLDTGGMWIVVHEVGHVWDFCQWRIEVERPETIGGGNA